jgi:hypothetical protein
MIYKWSVFHIYVNYRRVCMMVDGIDLDLWLTSHYENPIWKHHDWFIGIFIMESPGFPSDKLPSGKLT